MTAYRLDPILTGRNNPRWARSYIREMVWAGAATPDAARQLVALKTLSLIAPSPGSQVLRSPWYDDQLATCVLDISKSDVPDGAVIRANGNSV